MQRYNISLYKIIGHYVMIFLLFISFVAVIYSLFVVSDKVTQFNLNQIVDSAKNSLYQMSAIRKYYAEHIVQTIIKDGVSDIAVTQDYQHMGNAIPLPATLLHDVSDLLAEKGTTYRLYSKFPFPVNGARGLDDFALSAWDYLLANPDAEFVRQEEINGKDIVRIAIADKMLSQSCVNCHNNHAESPKTNWQVGDFAGILELNYDASALIKNKADISDKAFVFIGICASVLLIFLISYIRYILLLKKVALDSDIVVEMQKRADTILDNLAEAIITIEQNGNIRFFNSAAESIFGYSRREVLGKNISMLLPQKHRTEHNKYLDRHMETGTVHFMGKPRRVDAIAKGGKVIKVEILVNKIMVDGEVLFTSSLHDVSMLEKLEEEIKYEKAHLEEIIAEKTANLIEEKVRSEASNLRLQKESSLASLLHEATVAVNADSTLEDAVQVCLNLIAGYTWWVVGVAYIADEKGGFIPSGASYVSDDMLQILIDRLKKDNILSNKNSVLLSLKDNAETVVINDLANNYSGSIKQELKEFGISSLLAFPLVVDDKVVGAMLFLADAAENRNEQLIKTINNIGTQLGRAVERLQTKQSLLVAVEKADKYHRAEEEFIANISNELKKPVSAITLSSQIANNALVKDPENAKDHLIRISKNSREIMALLNDVLNLSDMESGNYSLKMTKTKLSELVDGVYEQYKTQFDNKDIIYNKLFESKQEVYLDIDRVTQVVLDLFSNAVKFSPENTVVSVGIKDVTIDHVQYIQCTIEDQGLGIPGDELKSVFDKFIQSSKTKDVTSGTGLGLAMCREIINAHNGMIWAESKKNKGSAFIFCIPVEYSQRNKENL